MNDTINIEINENNETVNLTIEENTDEISINISEGNEVINLTIEEGGNSSLEGRVFLLEERNHFENIVLITSNEAQSDFLNA